jgi:dihydroorotase
MKILIKKGRIIDPANKIDKVDNLLIVNGRIEKIGNIHTYPDIEINAKELWVLPGLIDMHVHFREPGKEHVESIESGCLSAIHGGFTTVVMMANTQPPVDTPELVRFIKSKAMLVDVLPVSAITEKLDGTKLTDFKKMAEAGAIAFSDDGKPVSNPSVMLEALKKAKEVNRIIISHCEDLTLSKNGVINEGKVSKKLNLPGIPSLSESTAVSRDINLAKQASTKIHITHVSTRQALEHIKNAKMEGVPVTCDVTPHHLTLTEERLETANPVYKMNPPLRTRDDVESLIEGIETGVIDAIASDHAPHSPFKRLKDIKDAPFGVIGLETTFPVVLTELFYKRKISLHKIISCLTINPARILGINKGTLSEGAIADITLVDPDREWKINPHIFKSSATNTPFAWMKVKGKIVETILSGKIYHTV